MRSLSGVCRAVVSSGDRTASEREWFIFEAARIYFGECVFVHQEMHANALNAFILFLEGARYILGWFLLCVVASYFDSRLNIHCLTSAMLTRAKEVLFPMFKIILRGVFHFCISISFL